MGGWLGWFGNRDAVATLAALEKSLAVIEFLPDGTIITANPNFLRIMGYTLAEIKGQHHRLFVDPARRDSAEYRALWEGLSRGEYKTGQFRRVGKGGREIWVEASYTPVPGRDGRPVKIVKFGTDITARHADHADLISQRAAIDRSVAVIELGMDGTVLTANSNFLRVMGYGLDEIRGRPHSMFVDAAYRDSSEYRLFWDRLKRGEFVAGQFRRVGRGGKEVWLEASYNPILGADGMPVKVLKFATDITQQMRLLAELKTLIDRNFGNIEGIVHGSTAQAAQATEAVRAATDKIGTMVESTEALAASVREIAATMEQSRVAMNEAGGQIRAAGDATKRLAETSDSMGGFVALIRGIAGQINLLALNATIESARAGEAGRGFAVVAGEVKNLAQQAGSATNQIGDGIERMQAVVREVVGALGEIGKSVDNVQHFISGTASAVQEQSAVTEGMSQDMRITAASVTAINDNMSAIAASVGQVDHALNETKSAAKVLAVRS
jgi:methyl-accepting chemotaxis protein